MSTAPAPDARARAEKAMREADPARLAELRRRAETPENSFRVEEALQSPESPEDRLSANAVRGTGV